MADPVWLIEPLALGDCAELGRVHIAVWREAYAGVMADEYLAGLSPERSAERWRAWFETSRDDEGGAATLVARDADGSVVGFISTGPSRDDDAPTGWELYAINLLARVRGTGLADALLRRGLGKRDATLWVVESNDRARRFYARHGFVDEGGRADHEATGTPEIRMIRRQ